LVLTTRVQEWQARGGPMPNVNHMKAPEGSRIMRRGNCNSCGTWGHFFRDCSHQHWERNTHHRFRKLDKPLVKTIQEEPKNEELLIASEMLKVVVMFLNMKQEDPRGLPNM